MRSFAEKTLGRARINHDFSIEGIDGKQVISPTRRQNVYLIFKEAITNIVKHSNAFHVDIKFTQENGKTILRNADNGKPTSSGAKEKPSDSLGLSNMKLRAQNIDPQIVFVPDNGFRVELSYDM